MNKKERAIYNEYLSTLKRNKMDTIYKAYERPSGAKINIFNCILNEYKEFNGYDITIISKNCNFFTVGFKYDITDSYTGEVLETRFRFYKKDGQLSGHSYDNNPVYRFKTVDIEVENYYK